MRRAFDILRPLAWAGAFFATAHIDAVTARVPSLLVLRGPLGLALLALGAGVALAKTLGDRPRPLPAVPAWMLFAASALSLSALGLHYSANLRAFGDEPHYLIMAQSLWREHDLDLRDNYAREDFLEYTPGPLNAHYAAPRADGRPYPAHSPGLSLLLAPVYALGGRAACVVLLALCVAALASEVRLLALHATGDARSALFAWAATLGPPAGFYGFHVYTEAPSALALAAGLRLLLLPTGPWAAAGAALLASALPWLHVKLVPAAAALGVIGLVSLRGRSRVVFLAVAAVCAALYLGYYQLIFGVPTPLGIYGGAPADATGSPLRALVGLLLDRSFGLLPFAPVFLLALAGLRRLRHWPYVLVALAVLVPVLPWRMWWGGQCPPGRFLVPLLPVLGVALALQLARAPRGLARWRVALLAWGSGLVLYAAAAPGALLLVNRGDRPTRLWAALSGDAPLERYLPSLVSAQPDAWRVALVWLLALLTVLALDVLAQRSPRVDAAFGELWLPLAILLLVGIAVDGWARPRPAQPAEPALARLSGNTSTSTARA